MPLEFEPVAIPQQKGGKRVLAGLKRDLQRRLRPGSLRDGLRRQLKGLPSDNPALDVVDAAFAAQLVEGPDLLKGLRERTMTYFWHGEPINGFRMGGQARHRSDPRIRRVLRSPEAYGEPSHQDLSGAF